MRSVEQRFVIENLSRVGAGRRVLDISPDLALSIDACSKGYEVTTVRDVLTARFSEPFDYVLNCSVLGRSEKDVDLAIMHRLRGWMRSDGDGIQILTVPVGKGAYDEVGLRDLFEGYAILKQQYWVEGDRPCTMEEALAGRGLGGFVCVVSST